MSLPGLEDVAVPVDLDEINRWFRHPECKVANTPGNRKKLKQIRSLEAQGFEPYTPAWGSFVIFAGALGGAEHMHHGPRERRESLSNAVWYFRSPVAGVPMRIWAALLHQRFGTERDCDERLIQTKTQVLEKMLATWEKNPELQAEVAMLLLVDSQ